MQKIIEYIADSFLCGLGMTVSLADGRKIGFIPAVDDGGETVKWYAAGDGIQVQITAQYRDGSVLFTADLTSESPLAGRALTMQIDPGTADEALEIHHDTPWWMYCGWPKSQADVQPKTQHFLLK